MSGLEKLAETQVAFAKEPSIVHEGRLKIPLLWDTSMACAGSKSDSALQVYINQVSHKNLVQSLLHGALLFSTWLAQNAHRLSSVQLKSLEAALLKLALQTFRAAAALVCSAAISCCLPCYCDMSLGSPPPDRREALERDRHPGRLWHSELGDLHPFPWWCDEILSCAGELGRVGALLRSILETRAHAMTTSGSSSGLLPCRQVQSAACKFNETLLRNQCKNARQGCVSMSQAAHLNYEGILKNHWPCMHKENSKSYVRTSRACLEYLKSRRSLLSSKDTGMQIHLCSTTRLKQTKQSTMHL